MTKQALAVNVGRRSSLFVSSWPWFVGLLQAHGFCAISADYRIYMCPGLPKGAADAAGRRSHALSQAEHQDGARSNQTALYTRYARAIDAAIRPALAGQDRPLILVVAEPMASIFRSVCRYPHLAPETISLSADQTASDHELAAAARPLLDKLYAEELAALHALFTKARRRNGAHDDRRGAGGAERRPLARSTR